MLITDLQHLEVAGEVKNVQGGATLFPTAQTTFGASALTVSNFKPGFSSTVGQFESLTVAGDTNISGYKFATQSTAGAIVP